MKRLTSQDIADLLADESITVIDWSADFSLLFTFKGVKYFAYSRTSNTIIELC